MAPKNTISQLDLVLLGRRGLTARLGSVEGQVRRLVTGTNGEADVAAAQDLRPNLLTNSSFEYYDRGSTKPQDWTVAGTAAVSVGSAGVDGTNSLRLPAGASVTQQAAAGVTVPHASIVISVAAKTDYASQKIAINLIHAPGYQAGPMMRLDLTGGLIQTDDVPADGNWYRFYKQFILTGGNTASAVFAQAGSGTLEIDAAKLEKEDGVAAWLEPTAFVSADWGAATHIRNLAADNIVTGTLVVGGSISTNPRISVKDGSDVEIVTIGAPTGGFYGIEVKGAAGLRVSGSGSIEVLGGGDINVGNTGAVNVTGTGGVNVSGGGSVNVSGTGGVTVSGGGNITVGNTGSVLVTGSGVVRAGTAGAQRVDIAAAGLSAYSASNVEQVRIDAADGKLKVFGAGGLAVSGSGGILVSGGGGITVDNSGEIILTGTGRLRAGATGGYHAELGAGGLALYGSTGAQTILMSSITGKVHVFDDVYQMENGGKLTLVSGLVWGDNQGLWAIDASGNAAFGVSGVDSKAWGNLPGGALLDKGDVLLGNTSNYVWWDASAGVVKFSGDGAGITSINGSNITAGTIQGITIQTGSSGARTVLSAAANGGIIGYGASDTYSPTAGTGTYQLLWKKADGKLYFGGGAGVLSADGILINAQSVMADLRAYSFKGATASIGGVYGSEDVGGNEIRLWGIGGTATAGRVMLQASSNTGYPAIIQSFLASGLNTSQPFYASCVAGSITTELDAQGSNGTIYLRSPVRTSYGMNVGSSASGAPDNRLRVGNGTYSIFWDSANTAYRTDANLFVQGNIYWGTGSNYLSAYLNQAVLTSSAPTFSSMSLAANGPVLNLNNNGGTNRRGYIRFQSSGSTTWEISPDFGANTTNDLYFYDAINGQVRLQIGPVGNIGIQQKLYVGGIGVTPSNVITVPNSADANGRPLANLWSTYSSRRWKTDILPIGGGTALALVEQLQGVTYAPTTAGDGRRQYGFIAEAVGAVVDELVDWDEPGVARSLAYDRISSLHNEAIKELAEQVRKLKARLDGQEGL